jgi:hypothetical protein
MAFDPEERQKFEQLGAGFHVLWEHVRTPIMIVVGVWFLLLLVRGLF